MILWSLAAIAVPREFFNVTFDYQDPTCTNDFDIRYDAPICELTPAGWHFDLPATGVPPANNQNFDTWYDKDRAALLSCEPSTNIFAIQTHLTDYTSAGNTSAGLVVYLGPGTGTVILFGPFQNNGIRFECSQGGAAMGALGGNTITDVHLRIEVVANQYKFLYSTTDTNNWTTLGNWAAPKSPVSRIGLFNKNWANVTSSSSFENFIYEELPGAVPPPPPPPPLAPGCVLWLDASDTATVARDVNNRVTSWTDKAYGTVLTPLGQNSPLFVEDSQNHLPTVYFNKTDILSAAPGTLDDCATNFTFIAVWRRDDAPTSGHAMLFDQGIFSQGLRAAFFLKQAGGSDPYGMYGFTGYNNDATPLPYETNTWKVSAIEYDGRSGIPNLYVYDKAGIGTVDINEAIQTLDTVRMSVGGNVNGAEGLVGSIAELRVYNTLLDSTERMNLLHELQQKWGTDDGYKPYTYYLDFEHGLMPPGWTTSTNNDRYAFYNQPVLRDRLWGLDSGSNLLPPGVNQNGDERLGTLTSPAFILTNNLISARTAGSGFRDITLRLERQTAPDTWEVVRKAFGTDASNYLTEKRWNVANLRGETVRLSVNDEATGGWGWIRCDDILVLDEPIPYDINWTAGQPIPKDLFFELPTRNSIGNPITSYYPELTQTIPEGMLQFLLTNRTYDTWNYDIGPKMLIPTDNDTPYFTLQTEVAYFTGENNASTGLILNFENTNALLNTTIMFGNYTTGLRAEATPLLKTAYNLTDANALTAEGRIENIHLRIDRHRDQYTFYYRLPDAPPDDWTLVTTYDLPGAILMNTGLFCKTWQSTGIATISQFSSLHYKSAPLPLGTMILIR